MDLNVGTERTRRAEETEALQRQSENKKRAARRQAAESSSSSVTVHQSVMPPRRVPRVRSTWRGGERLGGFGSKAMPCEQRPEQLKKLDDTKIGGPKRPTSQHHRIV